MELLNSAGALPFLIVFVAAIYAVGAVGVTLVRSFALRTSGRKPEVTRQSIPGDKAGLSGKVSVALSGMALISGIILAVVQRAPDSVNLSPFMLLFPTMTLCAIGGVVIGSLNLKSIHKVWNFSGVTIGMIVLVAFSIWLLSPVIFPP
jgi:hypothetical protein